MDKVTNQGVCFHCGNSLSNDSICCDGHLFCCLGCKTVYQILKDNNLSSYYSINQSPGTKPLKQDYKFDFLNNDSIVKKLLDFNDSGKQIVTLYIPSMHCSSCIWVLENLSKLNSNVIHSQVNFPKKTLRVVYLCENLCLKELVLLLSHIGYPPYISLESYADKKRTKSSNTLIYKLGVAGFVFGNVMLLSVPEYFGIYDYWLNRYKYFFRWLSLFLSLAVVFYSASDYFVSAYKGLRSKILNIDVPLALGIASMFIRSLIDVVFDLGQGFFDSLNGLVFFLLIGKFFQQKTYNFLSFERDYKSYFPIGITRLLEGKEQNVEINSLRQGDRILIRNQEIIPCDSILLSPSALIDYSFVTGEATPTLKKCGDRVFAGGKQVGQAIELEVVKSVSQSYLTGLWSSESFSKNSISSIKSLTDKVGRYFTISILLISVFSLAYWLPISGLSAFNIFTSILIIACPCALSMSAPFALGNMLRIFGRHKFYLKDTWTIECLAKISTIVFDKTGTITSSQKSKISFIGSPLSSQQISLVRSLTRNSSHPLSQFIFEYLPTFPCPEASSFKEVQGLGIEGVCDGNFVKMGSCEFLQIKGDDFSKTSVHLQINGQYLGCFVFENCYRDGASELVESLSLNYRLALVSGDNESERENIRKIFPSSAALFFNQKPHQKRDVIASFQDKGERVLMVGDGLNDAIGLKQSDVGVSVSENINVFSPACDGILDALSLRNLDKFMSLSKKAITIVKLSFVLSLLYNTIGLYFAITNRLSPVFAAILMPLSSISMVLFTTISTNLVSRSLKK